jgi:hypothetical protein
MADGAVMCRQAASWLTKPTCRGRRKLVSKAMELLSLAQASMEKHALVYQCAVYAEGRPGVAADARAAHEVAQKYFGIKWNAPRIIIYYLGTVEEKKPFLVARIYVCNKYGNEIRSSADCWGGPIMFVCQAPKHFHLVVVTTTNRVYRSTFDASGSSTDNVFVSLDQVLSEDKLFKSPSSSRVYWEGTLLQYPCRVCLQCDSVTPGGFLCCIHCLRHNFSSVDMSLLKDEEKDSVLSSVAKVAGTIALGVLLVALTGGAGAGGGGSHGNHLFDAAHAAHAGHSSQKEIEDLQRHIQVQSVWIQELREEIVSLRRFDFRGRKATSCKSKLDPSNVFDEAMRASYPCRCCHDVAMLDD